MASKKKATSDKPPVALPVKTTHEPSAAGWHKIASAFECLKKWQYEHVRGIHIPTQTTPDHFAVGQIVHILRAHWFANHFATDEATLQRIRDIAQDIADEEQRPITQAARREAMTYFEEYVQHWAPRLKPTPIGAEYELGPALIHPDFPSYAHRTARLDDVSKYPEAGNRPCIGECKTTSTAISETIKEYKVHGQIYTQAALWETAPQGAKKHGPIAGVMLDIIQKGYGKPSKFARHFVPIERRILDWFRKDLAQMLKLTSNVDWNTVVPRNITSCTRVYGRMRVECPYLTLCSHGKSGALKYVDRDGKRLVDWKPSEGKETAPWE